MTLTLSDSARRILHTIADLQFNGRPLINGQAESRTVATFEVVAYQILGCELDGEPNKQAVSDLKLLGYIEEVRRDVTIPSPAYIRPDGDIVRITEHWPPNGKRSFTFQVNNSGPLTGGYFGWAESDSIVGYRITPEGLAALDKGVEPEATGEGSKLPAHSPDFRSILWTDGARYGLTAAQSQIVKALWRAMENGTYDLGDDALLVELNLENSRLSDLFRSSDAWGKIIIPGATKGTHRLACPT